MGGDSAIVDSVLGVPLSSEGCSSDCCSIDSQELQCILPLIGYDPDVSIDQSNSATQSSTNDMSLQCPLKGTLSTDIPAEASEVTEINAFDSLDSFDQVLS